MIKNSYSDKGLRAGGKLQPCGRQAAQDRKGRTVSEEVKEDFPGGPVVKTLHFHCRGHGFHPWLRN